MNFIKWVKSIKTAGYNGARAVYGSHYSHHSVKRNGSIKLPGLEIFKKSQLNVPSDPNFLEQELIVLSLLNNLV